MTRRTVNKLNKILDNIYSLMLSAGYDQTKLNKAYLIFNLSSQENEIETFNFIFDTLNQMNEKQENYEICQMIKDNRQWIK